MPHLSVNSKYEDDWSILFLEGDLDVYTVARLREAIDKSIAQGRYRIAIDLSQVGFLDSTGLAAMVGGMKRAAENDGELVLVSPTEQIKRILTTTGLVRLLPVYKNIEDIGGPTTLDQVEAQVEDKWKKKPSN